MATDFTGDTVSSHERGYETADDHFGTEGGYNTDDYGSDTPNAVLSEDEMEGEQEWHDSPVIPRASPENTPRPGQRMWGTSAPRDTYRTSVNTYGMGGETTGMAKDVNDFDDMEITPKDSRPRVQIPRISPTTTNNNRNTTRPRVSSFSETESTHSLSNSLLTDDLDDINTPIFSQPPFFAATTVLPTTGITAAPITGTVIPSSIPVVHSSAPAPVPIDINIIPPGSSGTIDSEGSWLSGKMDIQNAVRKSFHGSSITSPIVLEASSPFRSDSKGQGWGQDYQGDDYGNEGKEGFEQEVERVRQGSKARRVEVVDSPSLEGLEARLSGESPERRMNGNGGSDGGIVLF